VLDGDSRGSRKRRDVLVTLNKLGWSVPKPKADVVGADPDALRSRLARVLQAPHPGSEVAV